MDNFGVLGRAWCETDEAETSRETLIQHLLSGQYEDPSALWRSIQREVGPYDVTAEIANELSERCGRIGEAPTSLREFRITSIHQILTRSPPWIGRNTGPQSLWVTTQTMQSLSA